jgi:hypothetical protein
LQAISPPTGFARKPATAPAPNTSPPGTRSGEVFRTNTTQPLTFVVKPSVMDANAAPLVTEVVGPGGCRADAPNRYRSPLAVAPGTVPPPRSSVNGSWATSANPSMFPSPPRPGMVHCPLPPLALRVNVPGSTVHETSPVCLTLPAGNNAPTRIKASAVTGSPGPAGALSRLAAPFISTQAEASSRRRSLSDLTAVSVSFRYYL